MKRTFTAVLLIGGVGVGMLLWGAAVPASADGGSQAALTVAATTAAMGDSPHAYVGSSKCKKCHMKQNKSWKKTKMGNALETLRPGVKADAKKAHGLDPTKDYTTDATCLKCHTTGHGHEGGYFIPDAGDKKALKKAGKLAGVGCESCHGPGAEYIKVFEDIQKNKRKYDVKELYSVGLTKMDAKACTNCHNETSPTYDASKPFDFDSMKDTDTHEHIPLKQRD